MKSQRPHRDQQHCLQHCWPWRTLCVVRAGGVHTQSSPGDLTPSSHCTVSLPTPLFTPISSPSSPHTPNHHAPLQQLPQLMLLGNTCTAETSLKTDFFPKCLSGQLDPHLIRVMTPPETITKSGMEAQAVGVFNCTTRSTRRFFINAQFSFYCDVITHLTAFPLLCTPLC